MFDHIRFYLCGLCFCVFYLFAALATCIVQPDHIFRHVEFDPYHISPFCFTFTSFDPCNAVNLLDGLSVGKLSNKK